MKKFILSGDHDDDYFIEEIEMSPEQWSVLMICHHQGQCDDDCEGALYYFEVKDIDKARKYLVECGIERSSLKDDKTVSMYYLWMLSGDIQDRSFRV